MKGDEIDLFNHNKSVDEVQLETAIKIIHKAGFRVVRNAQEAKQIAIESGYQVTEPLLVNENIKTLLDLRNYFFKRLWDKYPDRVKFYVSDIKTELKLIKLFVESREETGLNRFNAIQQCVAIIDIIFDHEDEFNFKEPINIKVIGQGKSRWITEKALQILNDKLLLEHEKIKNRKIEEIENNIKIDLKERSKELHELLTKMEATNG